MPLKLYRRGATWHYRGTVAGRLLRGSCKTADETTARRIAAEKEARAWRGHLDGPEAVLTFAQAAILYRQAGKQTRFLDRVEDYWKDTLVRDIGAGAVRQAAVVLYPKAAAATRNRQVIVPTRAVINHAAEMDLCPHLRVRRFRETKTHREPLDGQWLNAFAAHAPARLAALAWFSYVTGARIGEATRLVWEDVDLAAAAAVLRQPKGQDDRAVHLPPAMVAMLANLEGEKAPRRRVFGYSGRGSVYGPWRTAVARAGIDMRTPHGGRHGFATGLLRAGIDVPTVARLGGWKSPRLVVETYGHATRDPTLTDLLAAAIAPELHQDTVRSPDNRRSKRP